MATGLRHVLLVLCGMVYTTSQDATVSPSVSRMTENTQCPEPCTCQPSTRGLLVTCQDGDMQTTIRQVPSETYSLKYLLSDQFDETDVTFGHLDHLNILELSSVDTTVYENKPATIRRSDIFEGLSNLKILKLHISLRCMEPEALVHVKNISELDLSHTRYLERGGLVPILEAIRKFGIPIRKLKIRNIQHPSSVRVKLVLDMREDILRHLEDVPIDELDLGSNGLVKFTPGFMEFLPNLQFLDARDTDIADDQNLWRCSILDLLLHPAIKRIALGVTVKNSGRYRRFAFGNNFLGDECLVQVLAGKDASCRMVQCLCSRSQSLPCEFIPPITEIIGFDGSDECGGIVWGPMPAQLEELHMAHVDMNLYNTITDQGHYRTICVSERNRLQYVDVSNIRLGEIFPSGLPTVKGLLHIRFLNLQHNLAEFTTFTIFKYSINVEYLLIGGNTVRLDLDVNSRFFARNHKLRTLDLQDCKINFIPRLEFDMLPRQEVLNLSKNALTGVNVDISNLKKLRLLNLSHNEIEVLPGNFTRMLDSIAADHKILVDLSQNRLQCGCQDSAFISWLLNTKVTLVNKDNLQCRHEFLGLVSVDKVVVPDLEQFCLPSYLILITISVVCTLAVVGAIVLAVFGYRRRWTIRFHIHAARESWMTFIRKKRVAEGHTYQFDAFVIYNADDRQWVHGTLMKTLEDDYGMRLCIHYRDLIPGHDIEDTIVDSINKSRKTVVVLSPNFLRSDWCNFEFKMARQMIVMDGVDVIIFVLLEDLPTEGVSKTLARLLQKKTYLMWTEDKDGKKLFWDQLSKAINDKYTVDPEP